MELPLSCRASSNVVGVEAHELGVRIPLYLHVWSNIFKFKFTFTVVRTLANVGFVRLFSFNHFIHAKMADVVLAATTDKHVIEVTQAKRTVELELVPCITVLREKITTFDIFYFMTCLYHYVCLFLFFYFLRDMSPLTTIRKQHRSSLEFSIVSFKLCHISCCCSLSCSILRS